MLKKDCFKIGDITKANASQGELSVKFLNNLSDNIFDKLESIFIEIDGILVPFFIKEFRKLKNSSARLIFEDIEDIEVASEFINRELFLLKKDFPNNDVKEEVSDIIGYSIFDITFDKIIGQIDEVLNFKNNSVIKLEIDNTEVLIPIADEIIINIDEEKQLVTIISPEGLLDVYLQE